MLKSLRPARAALVTVEKRYLWIGAIRLVVATENQRNAGTDSVVQAVVMRDETPLVTLNLDYSTENDLERGAVRSYDYVGPTKLPRKNNKTLELAPGIGQTPMPYPGFGLEYTWGLPNHLQILLRIRGDDMWIKDTVSLYVRQLRLRATTFDTVEWILDDNWSFVTDWTQDARLSIDQSEGSARWKLILQ